MIRRLTTTFPLFLMAICVADCSAPTTATSLDVAMTASPDPAVAEASSGVTYSVTNADGSVTTLAYDWKTSFTVNIQESGGLDVDVTAVTVRVQQASGGIVSTPTTGETEKYTYSQSASTNHLAANGSLGIAFQVWYHLPDLGKEALVTIGFSFRDANGYTYSKTEEVKIAP